MHPRILNIADAPYADLAESSRRMGSEMPTARYGGRRAELGRAIGARKLGYNVTIIAPGKRAAEWVRSENHLTRMNADERG